MFKQIRFHFVPAYLWCGAIGFLAVLSVAPLVPLTSDFFRAPSDQSHGDALFLRALFILLIWALCEIAVAFLSSIVRYEIHAVLQKQVLQTLERLPDMVSFAEKRRRVFRDLSTIENWFGDKLLHYFAAGVTLLASLGIWFFLNPYNAMRAVAVTILWAGCFAWLRPRKIPALRASKKMLFKQTRLFQEVLSGARAVQSLLSIPFILRRHESLHRDQRKSHWLRSARFLSENFLFQILSLSTGLLLWAWMMDSLEGITIDHQFYATLWCLLILLAGWRMRSVVDETAQMRRAVRMVFEKPSALPSPAGGYALPLVDKMIWGFEFNHCRVKAGGRTASIHRPVEIGRGNITVFLGPTGSGKSLMLEAVCGLRHAEWGELKILDAFGNGVLPSAETHPPSTAEPLRVPKELFSYVESSPFLFQGTIAENLALGNTQRLSDMTLWQHLELVGLLPLVKALGGLAAPLPRGTGRLSQSESFRFALARALLLDRPFLALDDPFRVLDEHSWRRLVPLFQLQKEFCGLVIASRQLPPGLQIDKVVPIA